MRSEENSIGSEYQSVLEEHMPMDPDTSAATEFVFPADEIANPGFEFADMKGEPTKEESAAHQQKKRKKKRHDSLVRKMSYMVASAVAVITISQTLGGAIEQNVVAAGGSVKGDLRFSIQWNEKLDNQDDLDAHCLEPGGYDIFYGNARTLSPAGGELDVDIINPGEHVAVENIIYADRRVMENGTYQLAVHCFSKNGGVSGFKAQIEIRGRIYNFKYDKALEDGETIVVAEVTVENGRFSLNKKLK